MLPERVFAAIIYVDDPLTTSNNPGNFGLPSESDAALSVAAGRLVAAKPGSSGQDLHIPLY
jgi:hypothetical protein